MSARAHAAIVCVFLATGRIGWATGPVARLETGARGVHGLLEGGLAESVAWVDRFFGGDREEAGTEHSRVRVFTDVVWGRGGEWSVAGSARASIELPRTERRLHLVVRSVENLVGEAMREPREADNAGLRGSFAGVRRTLLDEAGTLVNLRGGLRLSMSFRPVIGLYMRHRRAYDPWLITLSQSVYWRYADGFGETSKVDVERALGTAWIGRSTSEAGWSETSAGVDLSQRFSFARPLGARHAIALEPGVEAYTRPEFRAARAYGRIRLRRRLRWEAWSVELMPEAVFPEDRDYRFMPQCTVRVELLFEAHRGEDAVK